MNFALDVVAAAPPAQRAIVTIDRAGRRRAWTMGEVARGAEATAARLHALASGAATSSSRCSATSPRGC